MQPPELLERVLAAREPNYTHARIRVAVAKADGVDRVIRGSLTFERGVAPADESRDYGVIQFLSQSLDIASARRLITDLAQIGESQLMGLRVVRTARKDVPKSDDEVPDVRGPISQHYDGLPAPRTARRFHAFPSEIYSLGPRSRNQQNHQLRSTPIVKPGLPIIPDIWEAIAAWTGVDQQGSYDSQNSILVILPDFRARIERIKIAPSGATIEIGACNLNAEAMEVRVSTHNQRPAQDIPVRHDGIAAIVDALHLPESFLVFLTDRKAGDVIDWAIIAKWHGNDGEGVEYTAPAKQLAQRIHEGENETIEFKSKLVGDRKGHEHFQFIQSVVAFANRQGGTILLGVQDDAIIIGVESPDPDIQRAREWVEAHCEPPVPIETHKVEIDGKVVIVVQVPEGENKPYQHKSNHIIYVRHGSTDRPARRTELDEIYKDRLRTPSSFQVMGRSRLLW